MAKPDENSVFLPIGVFWDIENCCVPKGKSALLVVKAVREKFFTGHREVEFMCVCDTSKENKNVIEELNQAQVYLRHVHLFCDEILLYPHQLLYTGIV